MGGRRPLKIQTDEEEDQQECTVEMHDFFLRTGVP